MAWIDRKRRGRVPVATIIIVLMSLAGVFALTSCVGDDGFGPEIVSMTVSPDSIPQAQTGMTDETVDVTITVSGFEGEISDADAFIQLEGTDRIAQKESLVQIGDTLELGGITKTWFGGLDPGTYQIGAQVVTPSETVIQRDLAEVQITP